MDRKQKAKARETRKHKRDDNQEEEVTTTKKVLRSQKKEPGEMPTPGEKAKDILKRISPGELKDIQVAFESLDKDGSGKIDIQELKSALKEYGINADKKSMDSVMQGIDENGDNQIDFDEFLILMTGAKPIDLNNKKDLKRLFDEFDIDGDGKISMVDLTTTNDELGEDCSGEELQRMFLMADKTDDNKIDFDDFYYIMTCNEQANNERKSKVQEKMKEHQEKKELRSQKKRK